MKQRLGIAGAMLTDPDLVILDEPANGLDPHGITEVRTLIRELADVHGKTVFLSSHQLGEVEQICDRVAIINQGELVREGSITELISAQSQFRIRAQPFDKAAMVLGEHWPSVRHTDETILLEILQEEIPSVVKQLVDNDIQVYEVAPHRQSLEEYFLSITTGENHHVD
jgi:ABC-2 type transport system ATP-binding protein